MSISCLRYAILNEFDFKGLSHFSNEQDSMRDHEIVRETKQLRKGVLSQKVNHRSTTGEEEMIAQECPVTLFFLSHDGGLMTR